MKHKTKILLLAVAASMPFIATAQITLEHQYTSSSTLFTVTLANGSTKYTAIGGGVDLDLTLYNLDHSVFKDIHVNISDHCPTGTDGYFQSARYITDQLFDMDSGIEVFTVANCWDPATQTTSYEALVFDENGSVVFSKQDAQGNSDGSAALEGIGYSTIINTDEGTKMILRSTVPGSNLSEVYSLPGTYPAQMEIVLGGNPEMKSYPNPVRETFSLTYDTHGIPFGTLSIRDLNGYEVVSQLFSGKAGTLTVDVSALAAGLYTVSLIAEGKELGSRKIVVAK